MKHKQLNNPYKKHRLGQQKSLQALNMFNGTNLTLNSDVD